MKTRFVTGSIAILTLLLVATVHAQLEFYTARIFELDAGVTTLTKTNRAAQAQLFDQGQLDFEVAETTNSTFTFTVERTQADGGITTQTVATISTVTSTNTIWTISPPAYVLGGDRLKVTRSGNATNAVNASLLGTELQP